jgi:hypothetical protein
LAQHASQAAQSKALAWRKSGTNPRPFDSAFSLSRREILQLVVELAAEWLTGGNNLL